MQDDKAICLQENMIGRDDKNGPQGNGVNEDVSFTLNSTDRHAVFDSQVYHGCKEFDDGISQTVNAQAEDTGSLRDSGGDLGGGGENLVVGALCAGDYKGVSRQYVNDGKCQITNNLVRRLTPLECERLQGYPDGWVDIPGASDSSKYKALGNSIALPAWEFWARRFVSIGEVKTIGSLFAGIGGFELCFLRAGAVTLWDSEIEPFCRKVLEWHFGNEETGQEGDVWKYLK